jgi:primosomal protein N' (replication factor Y)
MRARINGSRLVLASSAPSLEAMRLVKVGKSEYTYIPLENPPSVRIIDTRRLFFNFKKQPALLSRPLEDAVLNVVKTDGRVLFFLNRKGFATRAQCSSCGKPVLCPRCNSNLIYLYKEKALKCTHCVYSMPVPQFCPQCSAGYLKFSGWGAQKLESELSRLFPAAKNIHVETSSILRREVQPFDLVAAPDIDSILNLSPYSSSYEVFLVLSGLMRLAKGSLVIQTANPNHHAFRAITAHSPDIFYQKEFSQRRQGGLPPFKHILLVKVRSPRQDKAKSAAEEIYNRLHSTDRPKGTTMLALKRAELEKLRGNFYWNIVISASKVQGAVAWLKKNLRKTHRSGIIVTVDVDPV